MIEISAPFISNRENKSFLISIIKDEVRNINTELWFAVDDAYENYLCVEYADCFVLCLLQIAMVTGQDIKVNAPVSRKLLFNIENTLQPLFSKIFTPPSKKIKVLAEPKDDILFRAKGVGCGCSLGVDSLSSFFKHMESEVTDGYRVTHLTLFNSGQLGDYDLGGVEANFQKSVKELRPFSDAVSLPIVAVNTNLNFFYRYSGVSLLQSFVNRTICCALALQKLFGKYIYASSYSIEQFHFSTEDESHMEAAFAPLLGTENMEVILSNPMMNRVEKTEYISRFSLTPKFLQVCWAEQTALEIWHNTAFLENKTKKNCGWCDKCLRTLLTLEILGCNLEYYGGQFELNKYYQYREEYIRKVFKQRNSNVFYDEMASLMIEKSFALPDSVLYQLKIEARKAKIRSIMHRIASKIMHFL